MNSCKFYKSVTAYSTATDDHIVSIWYKEGNGERVYYATYGGNDRFNDIYYYVKRNPQYKNCSDWRRNYKWISTISFNDFYFNCNLTGRGWN